MLGPVDGNLGIVSQPLMGRKPTQRSPSPCGLLFSEARWVYKPRAPPG
jgi:hypothetical protein